MCCTTKLGDDIVSFVNRIYQCLDDAKEIVEKHGSSTKETENVVRQESERNSYGTWRKSTSVTTDQDGVTTSKMEGTIQHP